MLITYSFSDNFTKNIPAGNVTNSISDRLTQYVTVRDQTTKNSKFNWDKLLIDIAKTDW